MSKLTGERFMRSTRAATIRKVAVAVTAAGLSIGITAGCAAPPTEVIAVAPAAATSPAQPVDEPTDDELREAGLQVMREMLPGVVPEGPDPSFRDGRVGEDLVDIGVTSVFGSVWAREGLSRRDRSLVTLGVLAALGADNEMRTHFRIARTNGLTDAELAEVVYQIGGYAGFPAATAARTAAREALEG